MKADGIVLGVGAPNQCRDGKKTMCAIVLCDTHGLIRVYPIPAHCEFPVWSSISMDLERSLTDNRGESFKLISFELGKGISDSNEKRDILNACCIKTGTIDPIQYCNEQRSSVAIVKPAHHSISGSLSPRTPVISREDDEYSWVLTQGQHWQKPYIEWDSEQGVSHKTHIVGREVYMGLLNNPTSPWRVMENMRLLSPDYEHWVLLGNMKDRRNIWVGVHIHRLKKQTGGSIPHFFSILDGKPDGWPYLSQETTNVHIVDDQQLLFTTYGMTSTDFRGNTQTMH